MTRLSVAPMRSGLSFVIAKMLSTILSASARCCQSPTALSLRPTSSIECRCLRFFDFTGRDALLSAWPAGRSETAALAADFFLAVAVAFILTPLVSTVSSDCLGFGVGGAAVGGFAAGVTTALLRCEIFAPTRTQPRDKQEKAGATEEISSPGQIDCTRANEGSSFISMQARIRSRSTSSCDSKKSSSRFRTQRGDRVRHLPPAPWL